ncbi:MAG: PfkB family carbohydrate kinase [Candidatus Omnitrophota bacterium]
MSILVLGTVALDTVKTPFGARKHMLGGSAVHFSMSARLFTEVNLVAIIGADFPQEHIDFLHQKGIILTSLIKSKGSTFKWEGEYKGDLNTALTLNTELGVLSVFKPCILEGQRNIKHIFLANVDPDIQMHLLKRMKQPHFVGLDSMNFWINHKRSSLLKLLKEVNIYVANDQEARALSGENNLVKAAKKLHSLGPEMILIKKGEHGVFFYGMGKHKTLSQPLKLHKENPESRLWRDEVSCKEGFIFSLPAYPTDKVIDPTGAGDTFAGGFMGYLASQKKITEFSVKKALAYGTIAASFNVEEFGVEKTSLLKKEDLDNRLERFKKYILL